MNITEARAELARLKAELDAAEKLVAELEREPRRGWLAVLGAKAACASVAGGYIHATKEAAHAAIAWSDGWVIPMVELRPGWALVKVPSDREIFDAMHMAPGSIVNMQFRRAFANALGLREGGAE